MRWLAVTHPGMDHQMLAPPVPKRLIQRVKLTKKKKKDDEPKEVTAEDLEELAPYYLYYSLSDNYKGTKVDPDSCKYLVNKYDTTSQPNWVYAYGTVSLYDKYGSFVSSKNFEIQVRRYDASDYKCTFEDRY